MSLVRIRWALHLVYALAVLVKVASGLLLTEPDLRAKLVGGYGREIMDIEGIENGLRPGGTLRVTAAAEGSGPVAFDVIARLESSIELEYYRHGGILQKVWREMIKGRDW